MILVLWLALRDLRRDWLFLLCNVAMLVGVIVPLLVLFGVRNGVYDALIGRLLSDPTTLQIDTRGNDSFSAADAEEVRTWPGSGFVTLKTRSLFDLVNVRVKDGRVTRDAVLSPSGGGDPMLTIPELPAGDVAISSDLAAALSVNTGTMLQLVSQAPERPRQMVVEAQVVDIVPPDRLAGRSVLADIGILDRFEAFYDQYALPEYGIVDGRPLSERVASFEGLRVFARRLEDLAALQERLETRFGVATQARTAQVASVLGLGRNLGLALLLTASVAAIGLAAALVSGFWREVARKRLVLANLALLGLDGRLLMAFPMVQALVTAALGLVASFALFVMAAQLAERLFDTGLTDNGGLVVMGAGEAAAISMALLLFVLLASSAAAWRAQAVDPAIVLREGT